MESFEKRHVRFLDGPPVESFATVLSGISWSFLPELKSLKASEQPALVFIGTHAVMQIVGARIFGMKDPAEITSFYLKHFVDGTTPDGEFSRVAHEIHELRNTFAHAWFSRGNHQRGLDIEMLEGWKQEKGRTLINPRIYLDDFLAGFTRTNDIIYRAGLPLMSEEEGLVQKYRFIGDFLELPKGDAIANRIRALSAAQDRVTQASIAADVHARINAKYNV
jgi:hypothetical protein